MEKRLLEIQARKEELRAKVNSLSGKELDDAISEVESLENEKQDIEKRSKICSKLMTNSIVSTQIEKPSDDSSDLSVESKEYRSAFLKRLQNKSLTEVEQRAMTTATSSVGAVVPTVTLNKIVEKLQNAGVALPLVTQFAIGGNVEIPVEDTTADLAWKSEGTNATDSDDKIGYVRLTAKKIIKTIAITAEVEAMSIDAFEEFLVTMLAKKVKVAIDNAIINGTGEGQATGICTAVTETAVAETGKLAYDDLINAKKAVKAGYRQNACWMLSTDTLALVETIKDDNKRPIFKMETDGRFEGRLLGYPVVLCDYVPENKIIFGDFAYYYLNFAKQFEIARSSETGFMGGDIVYRALGLVDGNVALKEAFAVLNVGA